MLLIGVFRWGARLVALAAGALVIAFLVTEGAGDVRELTDAELGGLAALFVMLVGALLALRWELLGGALLLAGYGVFALIEDGWPPLPFAAFALAGLVLVITGIMRRVRARRSPVPTPASGAPDPAA